MTPGQFRLRVCYKKAGRLQWLSHLEVLRAIERLIRRANLDVAVTEGFSPHMKIAFGPALPVWTAGMREYADVWLTRYTEPDAVLARLIASAAEDLMPFEAYYVSDKLPSLTAALTIGLYRVQVMGGVIDDRCVSAGLSKVLTRGELSVERKGKTKVYDLSRSVPKDVRVQVDESGVVVDLPIRMGDQGSLRPEVLLKAALAEESVEAAAVRTTRLDLLVENDEGDWSRPV